MKTTLTLSALAVIACMGEARPAPAPTQEPQAAPPGLVFVAGGRYVLGIEEKAARELIEDSKFTSIASEYPATKVTLDDFYLMPTEVTNEQFAKYVAATGAKPPQSWGEEAISAAGLAYATETGKKKEEASKAGLPIPKFPPFPASEWWDDNWKDQDWAIPSGAEALPVIYIDHTQAEGYARWAGLRLISEEEFQAVARRGEELRYPWGDEFEKGRCNSIEANKGAAVPAGSMARSAVWLDAKGRFVDAPEDADEAEGIFAVYDLVGNVWEWTRSPFTAYKGFRALTVKLDRGKEVCLPDWSADERTAVGGAFNMPEVAVRATVRRGTARWQATSGLGLRCSASATPGSDVAESILRFDLPTSLRPEGAKYVPDRITAIDRWTSERGTAKPANYRVITGYDYLAHIPVEELPMSNLVQLKKLTLEEPAHVGVLSTTLPIVDPPLPAGTYTMWWRAAGKDRGVAPAEEEEVEAAARPQDDEAAADGEPESRWPFDTGVPTMFFRDTKGEIVGWTRCDDPDDRKMDEGRVAITALTAEAAAKIGRKPASIATFLVFAPMKSKSKGFEFRVKLNLAPGAVDPSWRQ